MKISFSFKVRSVALTGLLALCQLQTLQAQETDRYLGLIPAPVSLVKSSGTFAFNGETQIKADNLSDKSVVFLQDFLLRNRNLRNKISLYKPKARLKGTTLILTSVGSENLPAEGYKLTITPKTVTITGKEAGLFYGIQSLIQLFPVEVSQSVQLPCVTIEDHPRFGYRGMMLDVSRHFFTVDQVKKVLDLMAAYKLNNFQWHLTDGQGWRIEIKKYPKLTEVGGTRLLTSFGGNRDYLDQVPYSGFYTQDEIREVVRYAAERYINVIPEIEMPAHSDAALRAYPELKCIPAANSTNPSLYPGGCVHSEYSIF